MLFECGEDSSGGFASPDSGHSNSAYVSRNDEGCGNILNSTREPFRNGGSSTRDLGPFADAGIMF
jgi:hypothetical protein